MGDIHYLKDVPDGDITFVGRLHDDDDLGTFVEITSHTFWRIGDYTRSQPTAPSPGRVYRKDLMWSDPENPNWFIYICMRDPNDPACTLHVPHKVVLTDGAFPNDARVRAIVERFTV